jgi:phospho-N-acetylmuramoyl-pentapeptide-transferase
MLLYLFYFVLQRYFHALNVFRYITVRTALASITALLLALVLGPWVIRQLRFLQIGQFIREEGPKSHQSKAGTPTMGGVLIVCSTVIPTLLWGDLENEYVWLAVFTMVFFGVIGFIDDYNKVVKRRNLGLTAKGKFSLQVLASLCVAVTLVMLTASGTYSTQLSVPFLKNFHPELVIHSLLAHRYLWAIAYLPFFLFVV